MSNNAMNYLESGIYNHLLRTSTYAKPTNICAGLTSNDPQTTEGGGTELPNANGYARVAGCSGVAFWPEYIDATPGYNLSAITFPQATGDWGYVSGVILYDNATYGGGNALLGGLLTTPRVVLSSDQFIIPVSGISIQIL